MRTTDTENFCDITPLLQERRKSRCVDRFVLDRETEWADEHPVDEEDIPDMPISDDEEEEEEEDNPGKEFEFVKYEPMSEHNGTVRRWYRGFRH